MIRFGEKPKFEIRPIIEQKPFESPAVQSFFAKWCEINDSIRPQIVRRDDWEQRGIERILEKRPDGMKTLFIPEDLRLWEMVGVMEAVDHDTFASKPERQGEDKKKLLELGKTFQNAGIYIAQRLDSIEQGQEIARAMAEEFYGYGRSLVSGKKPEQPESIAKIASHSLASSEIATVDHFLAGDDLYKSRQARAEKIFQENSGQNIPNDSALNRDEPEQASQRENGQRPNDGTQRDVIVEAERRKTLAQFFRASAKAFELEMQTISGKPRPDRKDFSVWKNHTPIHSAFLAKVEKSIGQKVETPKRELDTAIFRRGLEKLVSEMKERGSKLGVNSFFEKLGIGLRVEQRTLARALNIKLLKAQLEAIRQSNDVAKISAKEREITDKIQKAVSGFPYHPTAHNPSEMAAKQFINCVGASTLGGALLKEAGINYLVGDLPKHSILLLVTGDGQVEWRDMLNPLSNDLLTDEVIAGNKKDGSPIRVADIIDFSRKPFPEGLMFDIKSEESRNKFSWVKEGQRRYIAIFEPEYGQQIQILNNVGNTLFELGYNEVDPIKQRDYYEQTVEVYYQAITLSPRYAYPYYGLGKVLRFLGRYGEAIEAYRQSIAINPKDANPYVGIGNALLTLGRNEEAVEAYRKAISIDANYSIPHYNLGIALAEIGVKETNPLKRKDFYEQAIGAYRQAIEVDSGYANAYFNLGNSLLTLGRNEEAVKAFQKYIRLADKEKDDYRIKQAEEIIAKSKE